MLCLEINWKKIDKYKKHMLLYFNISYNMKCLMIKDWFCGYILFLKSHWSTLMSMERYQLSPENYSKKIFLLVEGSANDI